MFSSLHNSGTNITRENVFSTIVIGSGIAGLYTALKIAEKGISVALITKDKLGESNSRYAQGGVAVVLPENTSDSIDLHVKDTLVAGAGLSDPDVTRFISENGAVVIKDLIKYGVKFDKTSNNKLAMTLEGAHSVRRVVHSGGDATGKNIEGTLVSVLRRTANIEIFEEHQAVELLIDTNNKCQGVIVFDTINKTHKTFLSNFTVLATGGLSQVYSNTTNPDVATGDGIALAYQAGATIQDMEFIQFHPTAFHKESSVMFLISEAVRGEGAELRNINGELFAHNYDKRGNLAPRDILTRAIFAEMEKTKCSHVYLDATKIPEETLNYRFPNIIEACKKNNIDITKDYIPVSPAAHYAMGGIKVNVYGQTTISKLYSTGEACCTSLHGANRLASNSLLECVVLAEQVAKDIISKEQEYSSNLSIVDIFADKCIANTRRIYFSNIITTPIEETNEYITTLKLLMWNYNGIIRTSDRIKYCLTEINLLEGKFNRTGLCASLKEYELRNLLIISKLIAECALQRKESRGSHYRKDYPKTNAISNHSYITKKESNNNNEFPSSQINFTGLHSVYN